MSLLDELKQMYGMGAEPEPDPIQQMAMVEPPPPPQLDPAVMSATTDDMSQPQTGTEQLAHPDVLSFLKELDQSGRLTGGNEPSAPKGMSAASQTVKTEEGGPDARMRAEGVAVRGQAALDDGMVDANRLKQQADELEQRAAYKRQDAEVENEKRQQQERENAARQERLRAQQLELADQADEPINPNRYFENMSVFAKGAAILSAAAYGYLGGMGQPPVVESLMQMAKEDTAAQMANNRAAGARRSALIDQYERQYGDTTLVAKRLEADKLLTMSKQAQAEALDAKSQEAKAAAEDIAKKLQNRVGVLHQEIQEATAPKPVDVSTTYQQNKPKGSGVDAFAQMKKAVELDKMYEERGVPADAPERVAARRMAGIDEKTLGASKPVTEQSQQEKKDIDTRRKQYSTEDQELADEETAMIAAAKAVGGSYDPKSGQLTLPKDMAGFGKGAAINRIPFTEASRAREAITNLADVKQRQRSGAAAPVEESKKLTEITSGANAIDEASVAQALKTTAASLAARRRAAMAGAGEDVLRSYDEERKKLPGPLQITPVTGRLGR